MSFNELLILALLVFVTIAGGIEAAIGLLALKFMWDLLLFFCFSCD